MLDTLLAALLLLAIILVFIFIIILILATIYGLIRIIPEIIDAWDEFRDFL